MTNKRSFISSIGLVLSVIGMAGLVLSIISLLPLNAYNIYTTVITTLNLLQFEHERTNDDWNNVKLSQDAQIYLLFLTGSCFSSLLEITLTLIACCRNQVETEKTPILQQEQVGRDVLILLDGNASKYPERINKKSWFIRIACFTMLTQILFSLFGTHIIYKIKSDPSIIPTDIQNNTFISCAILWINYLSLTLFALILLFASFFVLIGAYSKQRQQQQMHQRRFSPTQSEETRPLIV